MLRTTELVAVAVKPVLTRIRRDRRRATRRVAALLSYIEEHLFHPDLTVAAMLSATDTRNNLVPVQFHEHVGLPPKAYVTDCRLQVAARLLRETDLYVWKIAHAVGYGSLQSFSRAFGRWSGSSPSVYRAEGQAGEVAISSNEWYSLSFLRRALDGELSTDEALPFMQHLSSHYGSVLPRAATPAAVVDGEDYLRYRAERVWQQIKDWSPEEQRLHVSATITFTSPALFELLLEQSLTESRLDRARGVAVAELALASLDGCRLSGEQHRATLRAQAWAWIGNARFLALDFIGAEQAFETAGKLWDTATHRDRLVEAQLMYFTATLRMYQRHLDEARELQDRAIRCLRQDDHTLWLVRALIQRATIANWSDRPTEAIRDLREAEQHLDTLADPYLELTIAANLATTLALAGELADAGYLLPSVKARAEALSIPICQCQVRWIEGRIASGYGDSARAMQAFEAARTGFVRLGELGHAAVVSLDLALVHIERGEVDESLQLAAEVMPLFEALQMHSDALAALHILRKAQRERDMTRELLEQLHTSLRALIPLLRQHQ